MSAALRGERGKCKGDHCQSSVDNGDLPCPEGECVMQHWPRALPAEPAQGAAAPAYKSGDESWPDVILALIKVYRDDPTDARWTALSAAVRAAAAPTREAVSVPAKILAPAYLDPHHGWVECTSDEIEDAAQRGWRVLRVGSPTNTQSTASEASGEVAK